MKTYPYGQLALIDIIVGQGFLGIFLTGSQPADQRSFSMDP